MINPKLLSKQDRFVVAEYIYSQQQGILIKNDAEAVIGMFKSHGVKEADTVEIEECIEEIMKDYFEMEW